MQKNSTPTCHWRFRTWKAPL